jgi:DnaK suppressor protein
MNKERGRALLLAERNRVERLLDETEAAGQEDRAAANEPGDLTDPAERLTAEEADDAVAAALRERLAALERAERRLEEGTFGFSIRSGLPIPDARLEADPVAELTLGEKQEEGTDLTAGDRSGHLAKQEAIATL